jgi:hypothetical protein
VDTVVKGKCASGCLILFLGGKRRIVAHGARLGVHPPQFASGLVADDQLNAPARASLVSSAEKLRAFYRAQGVSERFISKIDRQAAQGMWYPSLQELLRYGVATHVLEELPAKDR